MPRISWFDETTAMPVIEEQVEKLASFAGAMADGVIERKELDAQQQTLMATMRAVEGTLNDAQHEAVTRLLVELSAYNVMRTLHELQSDRLQRTLSKS